MLLATYLARSNTTLADFALGLSRIRPARVFASAVCRWASGEHRPSRRTCDDIATVTGGKVTARDFGHKAR